MTEDERIEMALLREAVCDLYRLLNHHVDGFDYAARSRLLARPRKRLRVEVAAEIPWRKVKSLLR